MKILQSHKNIQMWKRKEFCELSSNSDKGQNSEKSQIRNLRLAQMNFSDTALTILCK